MKLLIVTQKVDKNDQNLGFFHRWIIEFAKHCESLVIICLEKGEHELPANVKVLSLGKEKKSSRFGYIANFYNYIWKYRGDYDAVFVHMNPIYVVLAGPIWKILGKKLTLWYTHKSVDWRLRIAEKFVNTIFTASKESFRLPSKKVKVMGHGIDVDVFLPIKNIEYNKDHIISVGRISSTKNQLAMLQAFKILSDQKYAGDLIILGDRITPEDEEYKKKLIKYQVENDLGNRIHFIGSITPLHIADEYRKAGIFLNLSSTGSLDKAILEAMACGLKILTSNEAFKNILPPENFTDGSPEDIAVKIQIISKREPIEEWTQYVQKNHSLQHLIPKILSYIA